MASASRRQHVRISLGETYGTLNETTDILKAASAGILSRRGLLQCAGWSAAAAALPSGIVCRRDTSARSWPGSVPI